MAKQEADIKFTISNLSLPPNMQAFADTKRLQEYAANIGADGYEITPTQLTRLARTAFTGELVARGKQLEARGSTGRPPRDSAASHPSLVRSGHASPRLGGSGLDPVGRALFPTYRRSIEELKLIQRAALNKLDVVLFPAFPDAARLHNSLAGTFGARLFQPKPGDWKGRWQLSEMADPDTILQTMLVNGVDRAVEDCFHLQTTSEEGHSFDDPVAFGSRLSAAGLTRSFHLAVGRVDCTKNDPDLAKSTMNAKTALLESSEAFALTPEGTMLQETAHHWKQSDDPATHYVTLEVYPGFSMDAARAEKEHEAMIAHARQLVAAA